MAPRAHDLTFAIRADLVGHLATAERPTNPALLDLVPSSTSLEAELGRREPWGGPACERLAGGLDDHLPGTVISYQPLETGDPASDAVARAADRAGDMAFTWAALRRRGVAVPEVRALRVGEAASVVARELRARREPCFLRAPRSAGGSGVRRVSQTEEVTGALGSLGTEEVLLTRQLGDGSTCNAHGFVGHDRSVVCVSLATQLVGLEPLGAHPTQYSGTDPSLAWLGRPARARARASVEAVGDWLAALGYLGLFGVDLAFEGADPIVLDVNPRLQASTWLLTEQARSDGKPCPGLAHVAAGHGAASIEPVELGFAFLVARSQEARATARIVTRTGAHHFDGESLRWSRAVAGPGDLVDDEVFIDAAMPGTALRRGAAHLRIVTRWSVADSGGTAVGQRARALLRAFAEHQ